MGKFPVLIMFISNILFAQKVAFETLFKDQISIRALQIYDGKVWYAGTDSNFGYVSLRDTADKKQISLSEDNLQFRTLAQDAGHFYAINIESPARFFQIDKHDMSHRVIYTDAAKTAFYDALHFVDHTYAFAFSDPDADGNLRLATYNYHDKNTWTTDNTAFNNVKLKKGEAAFAASNTNIASHGKWLWIATGGAASRIIRINLVNEKVEIFNTPFVQGSSSQGMDSIDYYDSKFGIAVGGDYTKQTENINNIATTHDGGKTWQIQASGKNGGYKTCVKFRPGSKGREILAVGDRNIEFSNDSGKTWTTVSEEKGLYICEWIDRNTVVLAGKNGIVKMRLI